MTGIAELPPLTVGQQQALDQALDLSRVAAVVHIAGSTGSGKSLVLRHIAALAGGRVLTEAEVMYALDKTGPAQLEEAIAALVRSALEENQLLFIDDWWGVISFAFSAPDRPLFMRQWTAALFAELASIGKTIITTISEGRDWLSQGALGGWIDLPAFGIDDKRMILEHHLGQSLDATDVVMLDRAYRGMDGYQLESLARLARERHARPVTGAQLVMLLDMATPSANVALDEVEDVSANALVGSEAALDTLERTVIVPITRSDLAASLGLRPARGVLLHGPPGTGKTTLGRLLAHRLRGKFFILDGTMFAGHPDFSGKVTKLLDRAAACSPSVVFIDDADVIFRNGQVPAFVRQLLSKLDGLAGESQRNVCLLMTAMSVADLPPALLRSGRVDVWIGLDLPDVPRRAAILRNYAATGVEVPGEIDFERVAENCDGFTPADLRTMVSDARAAAAYAGLLEEAAQPFEMHLAEAAADIVVRKRLIGA